MDTVKEVDWIKEFRKRFIKGHGPISCGDNYPQEADSWVEADQEELEGFIYSKLAEAEKRGEERERERIKAEIRKQIQGKTEIVNGETFVMGETKEQHIWNQALSNIEYSLTHQKGGI